MKKIILIGFLLLSIMSAHGNRSVNQAYMLANASPPNLTAALNLITEAIKDSANFQDARTWFRAGRVFDRIVDDQKIRASFNPDNEDRELRGASVLNAYRCFVRAYELDNLPNERGRVNPRHTRQITNIMRTYPAELFSYGVFRFQNQEYARAVEVWKKYLDMPNLPFLQDLGLEKDSMFIMAMYYTAVAAQLDGDINTAIKFYEKVKDKFAITESYQFLSQLYLNEKQDTASYLRTIRTGFERHPTNPFFLGSLIDYFIHIRENIDSAFIYVSEAIKANPGMPDTYFIRGVIHEARNDGELALQDFLRTVELNPEHNRALTSIGNHYIRQGDEQMRISDRARNVRDEREARDNAMALFRKAIPYLEKARAIDPKNEANLRALRSTYYKIYRDDRNPKFIEVDNAIRALR